MTTTHWTERSPEDFLYSIASDFIEQLRAKMKKMGMTQSKLAKAADVSKSYVSQVFNDPGNLSLVTIVKFAKAVGMKVSVVGYEGESLTSADSGPVNSEVFRLCWEAQGKPADMWAINERNVAKTDPVGIDRLLALANLKWDQFLFGQTSNNARPYVTKDFAGLLYSPIASKKDTGWDAGQGNPYLEV
ncbi:MAG: helix-turn-helix transcriptional regulator [Blastocatellia bacterium]|nr:helix-turn-helix transcriptional regulator [Blastocatellia bacterium]